MTINNDDKLNDNRPIWKKSEISFEIIIDSNEKKFLLQDQNIDLCSLIESVEKYMYSENGTEINFKTKIQNKGKGEKCLIKIDKKKKTPIYI